MQLPTLLYKTPGPHKRPGLRGVAYGYIGVATEEEYALRRSQGWFDTLEDALAGGDEPGETETDDIKALRQAYQDATGKRPFMGWDANTLKAKLAAGKDE